MSPFSPDTPSAEIDAFMQREARRRQEEAHAPALSALQRGVAFADGPGPDDDDADEPTLIEDPAVEETLEALAQVERKRQLLN